MTCELHETDGIYRHVLDHWFVDKVHLAMRAPYDKDNTPFDHKGKQYIRARGGDIYERVGDV